MLSELQCAINYNGVGWGSETVHFNYNNDHHKSVSLVPNEPIPQREAMPVAILLPINV